MSRGIALNLLASALTIMAATALLGASAFVGAGAGSLAAPGQPAAVAVVHRFYDAVNATLQTGDASILDTVLAPGLVVHHAAAAPIAGRAAFAQEVLALRARHPGLRFSAETVIAGGTRAMARVIAASDSAPTFLGLRLLSATANWSAHDAFRIADGRIVELWTADPLPIGLEPLAQASLDVPVPRDQALSLERIAAPAGAATALGPYTESRVVFVAAGALAVSEQPVAAPAFSAMNGENVPPSVAAPRIGHRGAGAMVAIPLGATYRFLPRSTNLDLVAFAVAAPRFSYDGPDAPPASSPRYDSRPGSPVAAAGLWTLAQVPPMALPERALVSFGRAVLPPGQTLAFAAADVPLFVVAETGSTILQREAPFPRADLLEPGAGEGVSAGTPGVLANLSQEPASVILITVLPADAYAEGRR